MQSQLLREDVFPFVCDNPECEKEYDVEDFCDIVDRDGLVYAESGDFIYQGIVCPECEKTSLKRFPRHRAPINLDYFETKIPLDCPDRYPPENRFPPYEEEPEAIRATICAKCPFSNGAEDSKPVPDCRTARILEERRHAHWSESGVAIIDFPDEKVSKELEATLKADHPDCDVEVHRVLFEINKLRKSLEPTAEEYRPETPSVSGPASSQEEGLV